MENPQKLLKSVFFYKTCPSFLFSVCPEARKKRSYLEKYCASAPVRMKNSSGRTYLLSGGHGAARKPDGPGWTGRAAAPAVQGIGSGWIDMAIPEFLASGVKSCAGAICGRLRLRVLFGGM